MIGSHWEMYYLSLACLNDVSLISTVSQAKSLLLASSTANHGPVEDTDEESDGDLDDDPGTGVVCVRSGFPAWEKTSDGGKDLEKETGACETETAGE